MLALAAHRDPDVYWIALDGYPRQDVLQQFFHFDNSPFVASLRSLGFTVYDRARVNFPETIFSISSTTSMAFLVSGAVLRSGCRRLRSYIVTSAARMSSSARCARWAITIFISGMDMTA